MLKKLIPIVTLLLSNQLYAYDFKLIAEQHVLPGYQQLAVNTKTLDVVANHYCVERNAANFQSLYLANKDAFLAWQSVQHLRFGPVQFLARDSRFQLWPDQRGVVRKHLKKLMADPALLADDFDISQKSIALQGFSALEILLYAKGKINDTECVVIKAITANLDEMARGIVKDWTNSKDPYLPYFSNPGARDNLIYESEQELAGQIVNSLYTQLELIITKKLELPLDSSIEKARGKQAEGWRSDASLLAISANLSGCYKAYQLTFAPEILNKPLHQQIEAAFKQAQATVMEIDMPLAKAIKYPQQRILVERLHSEISQIKKLISGELTQALDIPLGFNALDGD
jgi:uncharacterized protein